MFGAQGDEATREWRKLQNEELNDLYCSPSFVRVIKSRRMRWTGRAACMGERRGVCVCVCVYVVSLLLYAEGMDVLRV
jgi:hypothetical protein